MNEKPKAETLREPVQSVYAVQGRPDLSEEPFADHEVRRRVIDRVIDAGGEVSTVTMSRGTVVVRGRVGCRSEIAMLKHELRGIPGVARLELRLAYDIDDVSVSD
jgi:hypothetical protein